MATEEYSIGYEEGRQDGWNAAMESLPAQRKPMTDEQIWREYRFLWPFHPAEEPRLAADLVTFARAIEAKLKAKNSL